MLIVKFTILFSCIFLAVKSFSEREDKVKMLFAIVWGVLAVSVLLDIVLY